MLSTDWWGYLLTQDLNEKTKTIETGMGWLSSSSGDRGSAPGNTPPHRSRSARSRPAPMANHNAGVPACRWVYRRLSRLLLLLLLFSGPLAEHTKLPGRPAGRPDR